MAINFTCPHCGHATVVAPQFAGSSGPCARCGQPITVPNPGVGPTAAVAPANSSNRTVLIVIGVVLIVILSLVGLVFYLIYSAVEQFSEVTSNMASAIEIGADANSLEEIGWAINAHHDAKGQFPQGAAGPVDLPVQRQRSWLVEIAPFIEDEYSAVDGFEEFDPTEAIDSPTNAGFADQTVYLYQAFDEEAAGVTNWIGIAGVGRNAPNLPITDPAAGFFGFNRTVTRGDIKDGTSSTMMVASSFRSPGPWSHGGNSTVRGLDPNNPPYVGQGRQFGDDWGASVLFVDGSVRGVSPAIDPKVFESIATIAGGETVDHFAPGFIDQ